MASRPSLLDQQNHNDSALANVAEERQPTFTIGSLINSGAIVAHKDGNYGSFYPRVEEFGAKGIPFLTAKSLNNGRIDIEGAPRLSEERASRLPFGFIEPGDVLLSHNATVGRVAVVPPFSGKMLVGTSLTYFRLNNMRILPGYLAAFFSSKPFQDQLAAVMSHSTRNQVPITAQRSLRVVVPPLPDQAAIAEVLNCLDGRINLLREVNDTLEAMARAIFKSWFVDFDPVRAKGEGREPEGMDAATAALFPSELQDSELGPIPRGWSVGRFDSLVEIVKDSLNPLKYPEAIFELFSLPGFDEGRRASLQTGSEIKSNKTIVPEGAVLLSKLNPSIERVWAPSLSGAYRSVCSTEFLVLRGQAHVSTGFVYCLARSSDFREMLLSLTTGTSNSHQRVRVPDLQASLIVMPEVSVHTAFAQIANPLLQRVNNNLCLIQTLANLRDILLPRLISGKLRVPEAEAVLAGAL